MSVRTILLTVTSVVALSHHALQAQEAGKLEVRVYSVADIVQSVPDYPYLPGLPTSNQDQTLGSPASSGGGFGGGGAIGGGGGGFFQVVGGHPHAANSGVPVQAVAVRQPTELDTLIRVIEASIAPETWAALGGEATIIALGTNLIVRQSADVHEEIRNFLQALSQQSDRQTMVTIRAFLLSPAEDKELWKTRLLERAKDDTQASKVMAELERDAKDLGQITCFSGQQVHLAAGKRRSVVSSAQPVVSAFVTAYSPVITTLHIGTLLEFTATVEPGGESAMLDVRCTITDWNDAGEPIKLSTALGSSKVPGPGTGDTAIAGGGGGLAGQGGGVADGGFEFGGVRSEAAIERVNLDTQQLATTVRVPVAAEGATPHPVVIGTLGQPSPAADPKDGKTGLTYLVIAISRQ